MRFDYAVGGITVGDNMMADKDAATLRGKTLEFTLSPDGKVQGWAGLAGEAALEGGAGQFAMLLYDVFPSLPAEPMTVGMTWTEPYDIPDITSSADRDFVGESTYTVTGFKRKYEIRVRASFTARRRSSSRGGPSRRARSGSCRARAPLTAPSSSRRPTGASSGARASPSMTLEGEGSSVAGAAASGTVEMGIKSKLVIDLL